jgi:hypothetical protein
LERMMKLRNGLEVGDPLPASHNLNHHFSE